jgi:hypothetical protein
MKRPIVKYFSQGNVLSKEILMDTVVEELCRHLDKSFHDKDCDLENGSHSVSPHS